ncbi:MAG: hypothetical protein ABNH26_08630 [Celeribacter sp.]|jgi:putative DNA primase/helicase
MSYHDAMRSACEAVGIQPPRRIVPGRWIKSAVVGKSAANTSGRVMIDPDEQGGVAYNWTTGEHQRFHVGGAPANGRSAPKRDPEADRRQQEERREIAATCERIVRACRHEPHPYLAAKGFPDELGLVIDDVRAALPDNKLGERLASALPEGDGPLLVVPGRIAKAVTTVQFITVDGAKKNILGGQMSGAAHRIATGRETWVCEGIATALTVRAALRLLGRSATVLSAFSAHNVCKVASGLTGSVVAAENDKPLEQFGGMGTGEYYARKAVRTWSMPPALGDFNDMHEQDGLRAVALHLRKVMPP